MSIIRFGNREVDARPHVERAVATLGTIRKTQFEAFLTAFIVCFEKGGTGLTMRKMGQPMELCGTRMTVEAWAMLNAKGRSNPVRAFDELVTQICLSIYAEGRKSD